MAKSHKAIDPQTHAPPLLHSTMYQPTIAGKCCTTVHLAMYPQACASWHSLTCTSTSTFRAIPGHCCKILAGPHLLHLAPKHAPWECKQNTATTQHTIRSEAPPLPATSCCTKPHYAGPSSAFATYKAHMQHKQSPRTVYSFGGLQRATEQQTPKQI